MQLAKAGLACRPDVVATHLGCRMSPADSNPYPGVCSYLHVLCSAVQVESGAVGAKGKLASTLQMFRDLGQSTANLMSGRHGDEDEDPDYLKVRMGCERYQGLENTCPCAKRSGGLLIPLLSCALEQKAVSSINSIQVGLWGAKGLCITH